VISEHRIVGPDGINEIGREIANKGECPADYVGMIHKNCPCPWDLLRAGTP